MKHTEDPKDTLSSIRELPTEVNLQQVELMVAAFPLTMGAMAWLMHALKFNLNTIVMTISASLLVFTSMYLFIGGTPTVTVAAPDVHEAPSVETIHTVELEAEELSAGALDLLDGKKEGATAPVVQFNTDTRPTEPPATVGVAAPAQAVAPPVFLPTPNDPATETSDPEPLNTKHHMASERHYDLRGFTEVQLFSSVGVTVEIGEFSISATGKEELLDLLDIHVQGNTLRISFPNRRSRNTGPDDVQCVVRMPHVQALKVSGSGVITASTLRNTTALDLTVFGSGQVVVGNIEQVGKLHMCVKGTGGINLTNITEVHELRMNVLGAGDIVVANADPVYSLHALVKGSGSAHAPKIHVQGVSEVNIIGSGSAVLVGSTDVLKVTLVGRGNAHLNELKVRQRGEVCLLGTGDVFVASCPPLLLTSKGSGTIHTSGSAAK